MGRVSILLIVLALLVGAVVSACGTRPIMVAPGSGPDLVVSIESTKPVWPRNDVKLTVTVKNIGDIPAPSPDCLVIIRQAHAPQQGIRTIRKSIRALEAGDRYTFTLPLKLGLGLYEVSAEVDRKKRIAESDETNNEARLTLEGK